VRRAAPFGKFPANMRSTDKDDLWIVITRFKFTREEKLQAELRGRKRGLRDMSDKYCVIGNPIAHSRRPTSTPPSRPDRPGHRLRTLPGAAGRLRRYRARADRARGYRGANVTVPFKLEAAASPPA
jgi:hypothetical protein